MPRREEIEAVLHKHGISHYCLDVKGQYCQCYRRRMLVLDDLLACWTPPDRAELCELFKAYEVDVDGQPATMHKEFTDEVMTWAGSPPVPKQWCTHNHRTANGTWYHYDGRDIPSEWDQCPVAGCHAPRPTTPTGR